MWQLIGEFWLYLAVALGVGLYVGWSTSEKRRT